MRLFSFGLKPANNPPYVLWYRWAFDVALSWKPTEYWRGASIGFNVEIKGEDGKWRQGVDYYQLNITPHRSWGRQHLYYDGPHCSFNVGYLHFCWTPSNCRECYGEGGFD